MAAAGVPLRRAAASLKCTAATATRRQTEACCCSNASRAEPSSTPKRTADSACSVTSTRQRVSSCAAAPTRPGDISKAAGAMEAATAISAAAAAAAAATAAALRSRLPPALAALTLAVFDAGAEEDEAGGPAGPMLTLASLDADPAADAEKEAVGALDEDEAWHAAFSVAVRSSGAGSAYSRCSSASVRRHAPSSSRPGRSAMKSRDSTLASSSASIAAAEEAADAAGADDASAPASSSPKTTSSVCGRAILRATSFSSRVDASSPSSPASEEAPAATGSAATDSASTSEPVPAAVEAADIRDTD